MSDILNAPRPADVSEIDTIAAMHIEPSIEEIPKILRHRGSSFRFYRDKVRLFHRIEPEGVLVAPAKNGDIAGFLIVSRDTGWVKKQAIKRGYAIAMGAKSMAFWYGFRPAMLKKLLTIPYATLGLQKVKNDRNDTPAMPSAKIWAVITTKEYRRRGVGAALVDTACEYVRVGGGAAVGITVEVNNEDARRVYERAGFERIGEIIESTGPSDVMVKKIDTGELH